MAGGKLRAMQEHGPERVPCFCKAAPAGEESCQHGDKRKTLATAGRCNHGEFRGAATAQGFE